MASSGIEISSDEVINVKCSSCAEENRLIQADKFCLQCKDYYCAPCASEHKRFPALKGHKLLDKADFGSLASDGSLPSFSTQRCSLHPSKVVDMFCKEHDEVACASCIALNHRTCKFIFSIPENIDNIYKSTEMTNIKRKINRTKKAVKNVKKAKQKNVIELKEAYENGVKSIKAYRKELQILLDNMEEDTIKQLKQSFDRVESSLISEIKEINNLIDAMNEVSLQLKKAVGNKAQEFVKIKMSKKVTTKAEDVVKVQPGKTEEIVSFTADRKIKACFKGIQTLGRVSCTKQRITESHSDDRIYKEKNRREIDVKLVYGSCLTEDGDLLLTDFENKRLKRLDMSTEKIKDYIDLNQRPYVVCLVKKPEAVVTLNHNTLQFVSVRNQLTATRAIELGHHCFGLAYKHGKLFISDDGKHVYIYNMNGQILRNISRVGGDISFEEAGYITVSSRGNKLFVADYRHVVVLDIMGNYLTTLMYPTISGKLGMCTDDKYLFVASGALTGKIVQIGQDYKLMGELGKNTRPYSLCFDPYKSRLIVTHGHGNGFGKNTIKVLELE